MSSPWKWKKRQAPRPPPETSFVEQSLHRRAEFDPRIMRSLVVRSTGDPHLSFSLPIGDT